MVKSKYKKNKNRKFLFSKNVHIISLILLALFLSIVNANALLDTFPPFEYESFDGTKITTESLVYLETKIIIYGTPDALSNNRKQLDIVLSWFKTKNKTKQLLYTINFSSYPKLIRGIIKNQMQKNSKEMGINLYADWDGVFNEHFEIDHTKVIFFLLDKNALIYDHFYFIDATDTLNKISKISHW